MLFKDSMACISGVHCSTCRDKENGRAFRVSLGNVFVMPEGGTDFECPHGKEWNTRTAIIPIETKKFAKHDKDCGCSRVEMNGEPTLEQMYENRMAACNDCPDMVEKNGFNFCGEPGKKTELTSGLCLNVVNRNRMQECPQSNWNITPTKEEN